MEYKLKVTDGKVAYLTKPDGKTWVQMFTFPDSAKWMIENCVVEHLALPEQPDYPIKVDINGHEYYFAGEWVEPSIFEEKKRRRKKV